jgi:hypothetical protein
VYSISGKYGVTESAPWLLVRTEFHCDSLPSVLNCHASDRHGEHSTAVGIGAGRS